MLQSAEDTGGLIPMLDHLGNFYEEQSSAMILSARQYIEPVLLIILGSMVAIMTMSIFTLLFQLGGAVR
jgi:type II secretory pathway component PulF